MEHLGNSEVVVLPIHLRITMVRGLYIRTIPNYMGKWEEVWSPKWNQPSTVVLHSCSVGSWNENPEAPKEWLKRHRHAWFFLKMPGKRKAYSPKWWFTMAQSVKNHLKKTNPSMLMHVDINTWKPKSFDPFCLLFQKGPCALKASPSSTHKTCCCWDRARQADRRPWHGFRASLVVAAIRVAWLWGGPYERYKWSYITYNPYKWPYKYG